MCVDGRLINVREMEWMAVRWLSLPEHFTDKKTFQLISQENGLEPERVHARHLDLRLTL